MGFWLSWLLASTVFAVEPKGGWVDLTYAFDESTIYWPTEKGFVHEKGFEGVTDKGYFYSAHRFSAAEHGGTHIDAPIHFYRGRDTVDAVPLERLIGPAAVIDASRPCAEDPDYQVQVEDLRRWEKRWGEIARDSIVLIRTGFGRHWPDRRRYLGTDERGPEAVRKLHFPGLHPKAAQWLVRQRGVKAVGIDTASIDHGPSERFETHVALFAANVPAFENVANLDQLPPKGALVVALPMKIRGGSGGPLRIVARPGG
ncbi:MAG: cyclase family protein [Elusimicrobia bacterium]|nr:cyclase family protein [Elusimicrobiota bacterium]